MKRLLFLLGFLPLIFPSVVTAQPVIKVQAPDVVALDEQFNVTFIIDDEKSPKDFSWSVGEDFQLVWGPQKGSSTSVSIINGKRTSSHQTTYTYILIPKTKGTFSLGAAHATLGGAEIASAPFSIQVVTDGASSSAPSGGASSGGQGSSGSSEERNRKAASTGEIASEDLFLRLSLNRTNVVLGEPVTATLKLYQRVNIAGFENAKFPAFNGFWSQETYSPTNIEFHRESIDDKIYDTAVLRSWVLIPQQPGTISIDPAELVCLVNVRAATGRSSNPLDIFFQDEFRTIRKRVTTPALRVAVSPLPAGAPASFGGGVGSFGISAHLSSDAVKTHDAASLVITVTGRGNVSLLEEPKVSFPPDFEVYDTRTTENTDKSTGRTSGSKTFEYPFIPRSHGEFEIPPVEYSYYDVSAGKYVTLRTDPLSVKVQKGKGSDASAPVASAPAQPGVDRRDVRSLADDIRFVYTGAPSLRTEGAFFLGSGWFWLLLGLLLAGAAAAYLFLRKAEAIRSDAALSRNRKATRMALGRLKQAKEYLDKNLYTAFYEELHRALLGYVSDKLGMDMTEINNENIAATLSDRGVAQEQVASFTGLLDACAFARYAPDAGHEAMRSHYDGAVAAISAIDGSLKAPSRPKTGGTAMLLVLLSLSLGFPAFSQDDGAAGMVVVPAADSTALQAAPAGDAESSDETLWQEGLDAYADGFYDVAAQRWNALLARGKSSAALYCNLGDACFRQGNYPSAILHYERALKMDPSWADARYNLELCSRYVQDRIDPVPEFVLKSLARKVCYLLDADHWTVLFLLFLGGALALTLLFLLSHTPRLRRLGFFCGIALYLLATTALGCALWQKSAFNQADQAIVMAPVAPVKSSPSDGQTTDLFVLHEGTKVTVLDSVGAWRNIRLSDGRQGWIAAGDIEII